MKKTIFLIAAVFINLQLQSQSVTNYSFTPFSGTFTQLAGGTTMGFSGGNADDGWFNNIPVGFTFYYMGVAYTTVSISTNGWMTFGQDISNSWSANSLTGNGIRPIVAPLWDNLDLQLNTNFSYLTTGSEPDRIFTAEWLNMKWFYNASGNTVSFQVKLYEADKKIEFVYHPESGSVMSASASIGITATASGLGNFLSLNNSSSSPTVSSTSETTTIATKPADGQVYTFSPPNVTPADPISMTFTQVLQDQMTVNWVDNSTNETFFLVYFSENGTSYSQVASIISTSSSTTGTSYSSAMTGLTPGVTYYFRITANNEGSAPSGYLSGSQSTNNYGNLLSTGTGGDWSSAATWAGGVVPGTYDTATIADGATVIIDVSNALCYYLIVGQGSSGTIRFSSNDNYALTVNQSVLVRANAIFDAGVVSGASRTHYLYIGGSSATSTGIGNLTVDGTFDMFIGPTNGRCTVTFFGIPDASVSGSGSIDFYRVLLNKGNAVATETALPPVLEILTAYTASGASTTGFLYTHTAGTLKIGGNFTAANAVYNFPTTNYAIPTKGAFWLNNPNFTVNGQLGSVTNNGLVKVSSGTYNIGTDNSHVLGAGTFSVFLIENGTLNVSGRFTSGNTFTYKQTGGTVNVATAGNASSGSPGFGLTSTNSIFTSSGGTICIVHANVGADKIDYIVSASTTNITGGTLQLGNSASGAANVFYIRGTAPNVLLTNTSASHSCNLAGDLTVKGDLVLNGTGTFSSNNYNLAMAGMDATNPGNIIINTGSNLALNTSSAKSLTFSSSFGDQAISSSGTITGNQLPGLTINNTYGGAGNVTIPAGLTIMGDATLNLVQGTLDVISGGLTLGTAGTMGFYCTRTNGALSDACTFNFGTGTVNYTYNGTAAQVTGPELPPSISGELTISNSSGVTLNSTLQTGILNLESGALTITPSNPLTITGTASSKMFQDNQPLPGYFFKVSY